MQLYAVTQQTMKNDDLITTSVMVLWQLRGLDTMTPTSKHDIPYPVVQVVQ